jgi:hypothetical protein
MVMGSAKVRMQVNKVWIEVESMSVKDAVQGIAEYSDFFGEGPCGMCGSDDVAPEYRVGKSRDGDEYPFYSLVCRSCGAKLDFGQRRDGTGLFPKRKDNDDNLLPANGWRQWETGGAW